MQSTQGIILKQVTEFMKNVTGIPAASTFRPGSWQRKPGFFMDLGRLLLTHNDLEIGSVSDNVPDKSLEGVR